MILARARKLLPAVRALGPYLLVELVLPGGTLIAAMIWLAQQRRRALSSVGAELNEG